MAEQNWWRRTVAALTREYERRIRRASQISEYGAHAHEQHEDEGEATAIVNVPRGTRLARPASPPAEHSQEA